MENDFTTRYHIEAWYEYWYPDDMGAARKVTVEVPEELLRKAQRSTAQGITATIRRGLELVAAGRAYEDLRKLRGKVALSIDWKELRKDRE